MEISKKTLRSIFLGIVGCILIYWLLHETERVQAFWGLLKKIFSPFVMGACLAFVLNVPMRGIENMLKKIRKPGLRRMVAVLLTFLAILLVIFLVVQLLLPQITATVETLVAKLPDFVSRVQAGVQAFLDDHPEILNWIVENTDFENLEWTSIVQKVAAFAGNSMTALMNRAIAAIGNVTNGAMNAVIGIVFALYGLFRKEILSRQGRRLLYAFLPERFCDETVRIMRLTNSTFSNFISGQCLEAVILGCLFAVSMLIFRMPYIPLVSVLVAVTALVPLVGAFVGCFLGAFFILVDNPLQAVWFVVMFLVLQQIENNMIYPRVVGTSIGLPGMWVLVAVAVGGQLMGVAGMLLMIPLASVLYALLREITNKRLEKREIDREKLQEHPPELQSRFKEKRQQSKEKRALRKALHFSKNQKK